MASIVDRTYRFGWLTWNPRDDTRPRGRLPRHFLQSITLRPPQTNLPRGPRSLSTRCGAEDRLARRPTGRWPPLFRRRCVQSSSDRVEVRFRTIPAQLRWRDLRNHDKVSPVRTWRQLPYGRTGLLLRTAPRPPNRQ